MRKALFTLTVFLSFGTVLNGHASVKCIGPVSADKRIVFFHGKQLKTLPTNIQEIDVLRKIAKVHKARIAVVTSEDIDSDGQIYWDRQTLAKAEKSFSRSITKASTCWRAKPSAQNIVLMGFSSGGYLLNYLFQNCALKNYQSIISVEAYGKISGARKCRNAEGTLNLVISRNNWDFDEAKSYAKSLKQGSKVEFITFEGNHEFLFEPIHNLLRITSH